MLSSTGWGSAATAGKARRYLSESRNSAMILTKAASIESSFYTNRSPESFSCKGSRCPAKNVPPDAALLPASTAADE